MKGELLTIILFYTITCIYQFNNYLCYMKMLEELKVLHNNKTPQELKESWEKTKELSKGVNSPNAYDFIKLQDT